MKDNPDRHFYLYAKDHYKTENLETDLIKIQAHKCAVNVKSLSISHANISLLKLVHPHLKHASQFLSFIDSVVRLGGEGGLQLAIAQICLAELAITKVKDIDFPLGEADPTILPISNDY